MDAAAEQKVLSTIYDRLMDAITYQPAGKATGLSKGVLQMAQNFVLNPADYANAVGPVTPDGSLTTAAAFSALADMLPVDTSNVFTPAADTLSTRYTNIVNGANGTKSEIPEQRMAYDEAYNFLTTVQKIKGLGNKEVISIVPTDIAQTYDDNQTAYVTAVAAYRNAFNAYDLTKVADQRAWNGAAPPLQMLVDKAWQTWNRQGKAQVEEAQNVLASSINDAVASAIATAQQDVAPDHRIAPMDGIGNPFLLSYAQPSNWTDAKCQASKLTISSANLNKSSSSEASSYAAGAKGQYGLWTAGGDVEHKNEASQSHMDADTFELSAELILVRLMRPWYNPLLFGMSSWYVKGFAPGQISTQVLPLVPTALVVTRNVTLKANFSTEDKKHLASSTSGSVSVGWGPFSVSGKYANSKTSDTFSSTLNGGTLSLPGHQVIGVVCAPTPPNAPPLAAPK
jgi:hypothetical protein